MSEIQSEIPLEIAVPAKKQRKPKKSRGWFQRTGKTLLYDFALMFLAAVMALTADSWKTARDDKAAAFSLLQLMAVEGAANIRIAESYSKFSKEGPAFKMNWEQCSVSVAKKCVQNNQTLEILSVPELALINRYIVNVETMQNLHKVYTDFAVNPTFAGAQNGEQIVIALKVIAKEVLADCVLLDGLSGTKGMRPEASDVKQFKELQTQRNAIATEIMNGKEVRAVFP